MFTRLEKRARAKGSRNGTTPFEAGDIKSFRRIWGQDKFLRTEVEIMIVQPGLSKAKASEEQLLIIGSTERYVEDIAQGKLLVHCSTDASPRVAINHLNTTKMGSRPLPASPSL
ncbi:hypothetical protein GCM10022221_62260 [Actinocorallia aurea]